MTALIFALIKENYVAEQGARMVSMDGASKNAGDMIDKLNLSFNRMRQAVSFKSIFSGTTQLFQKKSSYEFIFIVLMLSSSVKTGILVEPIL